MTNKHHNNFWTSLLTPLMDRRGNSTDANNNLTTLSDGKGKLRTADNVAGKQDLQMTYSYDAGKQITAETIAEDVLADTSFTASYDAGNRITNWNRAGAPVNNAQSWNYDDNGNWISTTKDGITEARNHDNTDVDYRYDALGRRVIRQEGTTKTALIWWGNSEKHRRLVGVLDRMSGASEARRVKAREASLNQCAEHKHQAGQIHFIPFSLRQVVGSPPSLQIMKRQSRYSVVIQNDIMAYPSRLNSIIARAVDGSKFKLEWYHKNYLDHVYAVSDDSGDILEHYRYTAFGEVTIYDENGAVVTTTQIDNHILWNTRRRDEVTGFYMYKFRHYSAELGRWVGRDPIEEKGGVNLYGFVGNEPLGRWDKLGLDSPGCDGIPDLSPCMLEVCAQHDRCYDINNCTSRSWFRIAGPCSKCNFKAVLGMIKCLGRFCKDDAKKANYYDAVTGTFFNDPKDQRMWNTTDKVKPTKPCKKCKKFSNKYGNPLDRF